MRAITKEDYIYVDEAVYKPGSKYICVLCRDVLYYAMQTSCGHRICETCVNRLFNGGDTSLVRCPANEEDCDILTRSEDHGNACPFRPTVCQNCRISIRSKDMDTHLRTECKQSETVIDEAVPDELEDDPLTRKLYEKAMEEGKEVDRTIRVMVVGCYGQGKTTLVKRLLRQHLETVESTNGIDIHKCVIAQDGETWQTQAMGSSEDNTMKRLAFLAKATLELSQNEDFPVSREQEVEVAEDETFEKAKNTGASFLDSDDGSSTTFKEVQGNASSTNIVVKDNSAKPPTDPEQFKKFSSELKKCQSSDTDSSNEKTEYISIWDFGGQYIFYATHQLFHSRNAIYILVFNLNEALKTRVRDEDNPGQSGSKMKTMKDYIEFWVGSIHSFVGSEDGKDPPIILVGTHKDDLLDEIEAEDYFESIRELFDGRKLLFHIQPDTYPVAATDPADNTVEELRRAITRIGERQATKHVVPAKWIPLEKSLKDIQDEHIITFENVLKINNRNEYPIGTEDQVKLFLKYHHARGNVFYFDEGTISDFVVVNPQYIIDAFKCIITSKKFCQKQPNLRPLWKKLSEKASLEPELIDSVWGNESDHRFMKFKEVLIFFLKKHRIIAEAHEYAEDAGSIRLTPLGFYIVPSLLSATDNGAIEEFLHDKRSTQVALLYVFENEAIVPTIFQRLTAAAIGTWPVVCFRGQYMLFEHAGAYKLNMSHVGLIQHDKDIIELLVIQQCPEKNISPEIPHYFRRFVELMIGQEFMKFHGNDLQSEERQPYTRAVKCFHEKHNSKGSDEIYHLETLQNMKEVLICCPDNVGHESLCIAEVLHAWYLQDVTSLRTDDKRKITNKECSALSRAIGYGWYELGCSLGIEDVTLQQIEMDNQQTSMRIYKMFLTWKEQKAGKATLDVLIDAIRKLPPKDVKWDTVNNLMDNLY